MGFNWSFQKVRYNMAVHPFIYSQNGPLESVVLIAGRDSSVGIATYYGLDGPGIEFR